MRRDWCSSMSTTNRMLRMLPRRRRVGQVIADRTHVVEGNRVDPIDGPSTTDRCHRSGRPGISARNLHRHPHRLFRSRVEADAIEASDIAGHVDHRRRERVEAAVARQSVANAQRGARRQGVDRDQRERSRLGAPPGGGPAVEERRALRPARGWAPAGTGAGPAARRWGLLVSHAGPADVAVLWISTRYAPGAPSVAMTKSAARRAADR